MLTEMLKRNESFNELPEETRMILARLSHAFEDSTDNLFKSPEELAESTQIGSRQQWASLLSHMVTQGFIRSQIAQITQVAQRKTLLSLQREAALGNVQAIKQIQELSGIMSQEETNKVIILHQITRPKFRAKPTLVSIPTPTPQNDTPIEQ